MTEHKKWCMVMAGAGYRECSCGAAEVELLDDVLAIHPPEAGALDSCAKHGTFPAGIKCPGCKAQIEEARLGFLPSGPSGPIVFAPGNPAPVDETILQEAQRLVWGDRNADYGHPYDDYERTGIIWGAMLKEWAIDNYAYSDPEGPRVDRKPAVAIPPGLACLMMAAMKISRECNKGKRDNRVDLAGYAACVDRIARREAGEE